MRGDQMPKPWPPEPEPDELEEFLYQLENSIERAESPYWCVLALNVQQGQNLLRLIRQLQDAEQEAWHAGLDAGREQGMGKDHAHQTPSVPVGVEGLMQLARNWCLAWGEWAHDADPGCAKENAAEAELRAALTTALAQQPAACPKCDGTGEADSGGIHPWGAPATIPCDCQQPAAVGVRGLPRYGFPDGNEPRPVPCTDGYWTPWHLAQALRNEAHATAAKDAEIEELRDLADYMRIANTEATRAERLAEALWDAKEKMLAQVKWVACDCGCEREKPADAVSVAWIRAATMLNRALLQEQEDGK